MSERRRPSISLDESPKLVVVGSGEPTQWEVEQILGEMIDRGIPVSIECALAKFVAGAKAIWKAREEKRLKEEEEKAVAKVEAERRRQAEAERAVEKAGEAVLRQMLEAETAPPATSEQITAFVAVVSKKEEPEYATSMSLAPVPGPVEGLKEKLGAKLPALVFACWEYAAAFRGWLAKYKRRVLDALKAERRKVVSEQDAEYSGALEGCAKRFDELFAMVNEVIADGWGKDPKKDLAAPRFFFRLEEEVGKDSRFARLREVPRRLTAEEKKKMAEEAVAREAMAKAREQCADEVKKRLLGCFSVEEAGRMAAAWLRKWDGLNAVEVLTAKAVNFALAGEAKKGAMVAQAAGIAADAFDALVGARKAEMASAAEKQAAQALSNRGPQAGAMKPRTKPPKKEKGGGRDDNHRGRRGRQ